MKKTLRFLLLVVMCFSMIISVSASAAAKPHPVLNVSTQAEATQLDPHVSNGLDAGIFCSIFDGLVKFDGDNQMQVLPSLAESWEISEDHLSFTFHLVETSWHNGSPFTADDVVFSVERLQTQPSTASKVLMIKGAEAIDEHTVKITCNYAYPNLILQMASWPWRMVSRHAVEAAGDGTPGMVVGTGPYKLESWTSGVGMVLAANENYFGGAPYFDKVNLKLIKDTTTSMTALENGEIDSLILTNGLDADYIRGSSDRFNLIELKRSVAHTLIFNTSANELLGNKLVRQAFNHAINKDDIIALVFDGEAYGDCNTILSENEEGYTEDIPKYDYNPQKAKELLAEAGYPDGVTVKFTHPATDVGERLAASLQDNLKASGITIQPVPLEYSAYIMAGYVGDYETIYMEWQTIPYNPPLLYNLYFLSKGSLNYPRINNPEIDELAYKASSTLDDSERITLFEQLNRIIRDEAYYAPIGYVKTNIGQDKHIAGNTYEPNTLITHFGDWYWAE